MKNKGIPFGFSMEIKNVDTEKREIQGFASTIDKDRDEEVIPGIAFREGIEQFMKIGTLLYEHGQDPEYGRRPIGRVIDYRIENEGLWVRAKVSDDWVWEKISNFELSAFSWGGRVLDWAEKIIDGVQTFVATAIDLFEVSVVSIPANPNATFSITKSINQALLANNTTQDMDKIQEMFENINQKFADFSEKDAKVKSLKEEKKTLKTELEEKSVKIQELEKSLSERDEQAKVLEESVKALDEKLESIIASKKKAISDEEAEKVEEKVKEEVSVDSEEVEKKLKKLLGLKK